MIVKGPTVRVDVDNGAKESEVEYVSHLPVSFEKCNKKLDVILSENLH